MNWYKFYGGYQGSGDIANVILIGDPSNTGHFGNPLASAHASGLGKGIGFENDNYDVTFALNLVGISVDDRGTYLDNGGSYLNDSGTYKWLLLIETSKDGGKTYQTFTPKTEIFAHPWQYTMTYSIKGTTDRYGRTSPNSWDVLGRASQYTKTIKLAENTTHVRFTLAGENAAFPYSITFPIDIIIPSFRPMASLVNGVWKSLDNTGGKLQTYDNGWKDLPLMDFSDVGQVNKGVARGHNGTAWVGQRKVGN